MSEQRPSDLWTSLLAVVLGVSVAAGGFWYFTVYDTAQGKCQRGDLNACIVLEAQQPAPRARATATRTDIVPSNYNCYASVTGHDAVVGIYGQGSCSALQAALTVDGFDDWHVSSVPAGDQLVCSVSGVVWQVDVWDSGFGLYGTEACSTLQAAAASPGP